MKNTKKTITGFLAAFLMILGAFSAFAEYNGPGTEKKFGPSTELINLVGPREVKTGPGTGGATGPVVRGVQAESAGAGKTSGAGTVSDPRTNNADLSPELSGGSITFLKNKTTEQQQLAAVIRSSDGRVIVVDGGVDADAEHLYEVLKAAGGSVDAWLVTHPHGDHIGGLRAILRDHKDIAVKGIYGNFFEYEWYAAVDQAEAPALWVLNAELLLLPKEKIHLDMKKNDAVSVSEKLSFRVLNNPKQSTGNHAVNSSGLMYDITVDGKHLVILGDMGEQVGNEHYADGAIENISCDWLQTAHHGQDGVGEVFYQMCHPKNIIWNTTEKIYLNKEHKYKTDMTKKWFSRMNIENHYATIYDDVVIR